MEASAGDHDQAEASSWPAWAERIKGILEERGVTFDPHDGIDLPLALEEWIEGTEAAYRGDLTALRELHRNAIPGRWRVAQNEFTGHWAIWSDHYGSGPACVADCGHPEEEFSKEDAEFLLAAAEHVRSRLAQADGGEDPGTFLGRTPAESRALVFGPTGIGQGDVVEAPGGASLNVGDQHQGVRVAEIPGGRFMATSDRHPGLLVAGGSAEEVIALVPRALAELEADASRSGKAH